jgi:chromosome segregation protein
MQLVGFKSFADKTTIPFREGVTCIVGPNGCGKSNVADAVRWVLGAQSAKSLRGSNMQDVIFNGTERRRSLSFCEVTLTFDNTNRMFNLEYDEVAITRRLYRSGESEYLLNGQNCRLKDIVVLLHGVGIAKEGYSIIGQGKVSQLLDSKPEERRAIFEEATGIMMQKQRKIEIERKLAASEDNLVVYKQRIAEAERQIAPLARQAETAQKYKEYSSELRHHEINAYIYRKENAEVEKKRYMDEMERLNRELSGHNAVIMSILAEREKNRTALNEADERVAELNRQLLAITTQNAEKNGNAKLYKEKANAYLEKLQRSKRESAAATKRIQEIDRAVTDGETAILQKQKRLQEITRKRDTLTERIAWLDKQIASIDAELDMERVKDLSSFDYLSKLQNEMGSLNATQEAVADRMREVNDNIAREEKRRSDLYTELAKCGEKKRKLEELLSTEDEKLGEQNEKIKTLRERCDRINHDIYSCNARIDTLNNTMDMYAGLKNRFEGYRDSVRRLLLAGQERPEVGKKIKGVIADIVHCDEKYELAVETLFGGAMQNIVTATSEDAKDLIQYLKRNSLGVVTFLPVDAMKPKRNSPEAERALNELGALGLADRIVKYDDYFAPVIRNLLGNTLICDNNDNAVRIAKRYNHAFRIVTLEGDIIATSGAMTGGSRKKDGSNLLQNERLIKECNDSLEKFRKEIVRLTQTLENTKNEQREAEKELENMRSQFQQAAVDLAAIRQQEASLQQTAGEVEEQITIYHSALNGLKQKALELTGKAKVSSANEKELSKKKEEEDAEREEKRQRYKEFKAERDKLNTRFGDALVELTALSNGMDSDRQNIDRLKAEKAELEGTVAQAASESAEYEQELARWQAEAEKQQLTEEEQKQVNALREKIDGVGEEKKQISERQQELENVQSSYQDKITDTATRHAKAEMEISRIDTALENLRARIQEAYGLDYEDCLPYRDENYDITTSANEIANTKRKITSLGPVNENALEDYEALKSRFDEMCAQRDDVEKAIWDSRTMLEEIKADMREKFDAGFNKINANFSQVFKELFGGGKAELQLDYTDCTDPLDAGVVISACPPGKKLDKLSLLSGGEQALTAIAILFAIIKSNPMPFCILDEIEAALDDANVDRFAKYLKKFSSETQFIVITHRKPTMSQADGLFGVTMEEKGVSKIVSVRLSEVETKLGGDTVQ